MIKTRQRVSDFGEVFTSRKEVNAMLDLTYAETQRIDSRFLEPACGVGNFLAEVLRRKLEVVTKKYRANQLDYERYAFQAVSSIYGVDFLPDNVEECRDRMCAIVVEKYRCNFKNTAKKKFNDATRYVLSRNILWGDALTLTKPNSDSLIIFSEWSFISGSLISRTDYAFHALLNYPPFEGDTLFSDLGERESIPKPIREYHPVHFLEVANAYQNQL